MSKVQQEDAGEVVGEAGGDAVVVEREDLELARQVVARLVEKGVRVLALDFDRTIVSVHTGGYWRGGSATLVEHVRPCFSALVQAAVAVYPDLEVCVTTYSTQPGLIRDVIEAMLGDRKRDADQVLIRANNGAFISQEPACSNFGKEPHIAWLVTELFNKKHLIIQPWEVLLMDDDSENITLAKDFGHVAYKVPEDVTVKSMIEFVDTLEITRELPS